MRFKELLLEYNKEFTMKTYGKPLFDIYVKSPDIPRRIKSELSAAKNSPDITQIIEKPVPFPMPVQVNSNSESSNNFIPEINPLLLS
jgi:hypothetical protein